MSVYVKVCMSVCVCVKLIQHCSKQLVDPDHPQLGTWTLITKVISGLGEARTPAPRKLWAFTLINQSSSGISGTCSCWFPASLPLLFLEHWFSLNAVPRIRTNLMPKKDANLSLHNVSWNLSQLVRENDQSPVI